MKNIAMNDLILAMVIGLPALMAAFLSFIGVLLNLRNKKGLDGVTIQLNGHTEKLLSLQAANHKIEMEAREEQHKRERLFFNNIEKAYCKLGEHQDSQSQEKLKEKENG